MTQHTQTLGCTTCGTPNNPSDHHCYECKARLTPPSKQSLQYVWAYLITGIITFIPANTYPILNARQLTTHNSSTILGGVFELFEHGSYGIGAVVFIASILIPIGKFIAIGYLAISAQMDVVKTPRDKQHLYEFVELIGRWSMIDVFVVAILAALVQLGALSSIEPGIASITFALSVIFTMLAAQRFDPRLLWASHTNRSNL